MVGVGAIDTYLQNKLKPLLNSYPVAPDFVEEVLESVGTQIASFIYHWDDVSFRNGLAVVGLEEGTFYKPYSEINPFIVVAVRNSLIESLNSCEHGRTGLAQPLSDEKVSAITKQAIVYFKEVDFFAVKDETGYLADDFYGNIVVKYPMAWTALLNLGNSAEPCISYEKIQGERLRPQYLSRTADVQGQKGEVISKVLLDGISPILDERLLNYLHSIYSNRMDYIYFNCFKMLTRNFDKLLKVMEFVLSNDKPFVTCNYYISNGYLLRRKTLLRPARNELDFPKKLNTLNGTTEEHREALKRLAQAMKDK